MSGPRKSCSEKTPLLPFNPEHVSTGVRSSSGQQRCFFPSVGSESDTSFLMSQLQNMSALMDGIDKSMMKMDRSSLGLLPSVLLETDTTLDGSPDEAVFKVPKKTLDEVPKKTLDEVPKKTLDEVPKTPEEAGGLPLKYLLPSKAERKSRIAPGLDQLLMSMADLDITAVNDASLEVVKMKAPDISVIPPSDSSSVVADWEEASFHRGRAMSARSTSIGGSRIDATRAERFSDFSFCPPDSMPFPSQQQQVCDEEFGTGNMDNEAFIDAAETENLISHQFMPDENMNRTIVSDVSAFCNKDANGTLSQSGYFITNTSRLGSLETSECVPVDRPQLGLGKIVSPKRQPVSAVVVDDKTFTHCPEITRGPEMMAEILTKAMPGKDAAHYANLIGRQQLEKQDESAMDDSQQGLPSFLDVSCATTKGISPQRVHLTGSKIPRYSPRANNKISQVPKKKAGQPQSLRHSSPIKVASKVPKPKNEFPILTNRAVVTWISVGIGQASDKPVVLKNISTHSVSFILAIRDSDQFLLGGEDLGSKTELTMAPQSEKSIVVQFRPQRKNARYTQGWLVIKPHGLSNHRGMSVKCKILLQGVAGKCQLILDPAAFVSCPDNRMMKMFLLDLPNDTATTKTMSVKNAGDAPGFVHIQAFMDGACKVPSDPVAGGAIRINPNRFVIMPGKAMTFTMEIDSDAIEESSDRQPKPIGCLAVFLGPETGRQILRAASKLSKHNNNNALLGVNFDATFSGESQAEPFGGRVTPADNALFYENTTKTVVEIMGFKCSSTFYQLPIEDTMSESMMLDSTVTIPSPLSITCQTIAEEKSHLTAEQDELCFPVTKIGGKSVASITLRNRGHLPELLTVGNLNPPFANKHTQVEVKPNFFLCLPILYSPTNRGPHEARLSFTSKDVAIHVTLKGKAIVP